MPLIVGIDEAGYGPLLGPLCVGASAFRALPAPPGPVSTSTLPDSGPLPDRGIDLWERLAPAVCHRPRDLHGRVAVADSKKLKRPNDSVSHPLEHLERGVLAFLRCRASSSAFPADDDALLGALGAAPGAGLPWRGAALPIPMANDAGLLGIAASRLARALDDAKVTIEALRVAALDAPDFNAAFERTRSKASVNTTMAFEALLEILRSCPDEEIKVTFDRHGGRTHYRDELSYTFPGSSVRVIEESEATSRYELRQPGRRIEVAWEVEAESRHLPVALASMAAKLVRELWMARLNRYFSQAIPELKPTAGYVEDGRRWLAQVEPHLSALGIDRRRLVRQA